MKFFFNQKLFFFDFNLVFFLFNTLLNNYINCNSNSLLEKIKSKTEISKISNEVTALLLGSNDPPEDKYFINKINISNTTSYIMGIFDGHGGWVLSQYANLLFYPYFLEEYNSKNNFEKIEEKRIIFALNRTFARIEEEFKLISFNKNIEGNKKFKNVGTCALVSLIINNKLYTSNLGDSKAILLEKNKNNEAFKYKKVSKVFNCRKKEEQKKLKEKWPNMEDIYKCKREKVCYVKGRLQPTSTLGDYYLKSPLYNLDLKNLYNDELINDKINNYEGPFIDSVPDIKMFDLKENDKYLVMGSDGLWDYLNSKEIANLVEEFLDEKNNIYAESKIEEESYKIAFGLMEKIIHKSSKKSRIKEIDILDMPLGKKLRRIHDDITIIIFDLSKLTEK